MKPKLFKCSGCGDETTHVTCRLKRNNRELISTNERLCDRCVDNRKNLMDNMAQLSGEQIHELLEGLL